MPGTPQRRRRSAVTRIDWMILGIGLLTLGLLAGTVIRTDADDRLGRFGDFVGGLRSLGPNERLVLFEDGAASGADWSAGARDDAHVGLGAVWLVPAGETALERRIALPEDTAQATLRLELIAIDDWALQGLELALDGRPVLRQRFSSRRDLLAAQTTEAFAESHITLQSRLEPPRELGFASGDAALAETRLIVELAIDAPAPEIGLTITPLPAPGEAADAPAPVWAVDNVIVVARRRP